ncbi:hypothetical protein GB937_009129 [Aspergillus fischeri]|nr:hypothetical protein GB937_009129 [Aspergillus fischeri]
MLRIYSPKLKSIERFREAREDFVLPRRAFDKARNTLRKSPEWGDLLEVVETDMPFNSIREKDDQIWPGFFVAARRLQE